MKNEIERKNRKPRQLNTDSGAYEPGIFVMKLDTEQEIPAVKDMDKDMIAVFFHEYIHYLQDISTVAGYQNIYANSEFIRAAINKIIALPSKQFNVPIEITGNEDNVALNLEIVNNTVGGNDLIPSLTIEDSWIDDTRTIYQINNFREAKIKCDDGSILQFGTIAIMESMAYLLEQCCTDYIESDDFPYNSAKLLASRYSQDIANDPIKLIALCDMALMCTNPGAMFVTILQMVQNGVIEIKRAEDIIDIFYRIPFKNERNENVTLMDNYIEIHNAAFGSLKSYMQGFDLGDEIKEYFDRLADRTLDLRKNDRYFMIELARGGKYLQNRRFINIVSLVGFPILKNLKDEHYVFPNPLGKSENLQYISAVAEISNLFSYAQDSCSMKKWCKNSPDSTPDFNCDLAPWKKASDERLCPYALLWRHWKLQGHTPIIKDNTEEI